MRHLTPHTSPHSLAGHCLVSLLEAATTAAERLCPVCRTTITAATPNYAVRQLSPAASASSSSSSSATPSSSSTSDTATDARIRTLMDNNSGRVTFATDFGTQFGSALRNMFGNNNNNNNNANNANNGTYQQQLQPPTYRMQVAAGVAVALYVTTGSGLPPEVLYLVDNAAVVVCTVLVLSFIAGKPILG